MWPQALRLRPHSSQPERGFKWISFAATVRLGHAASLRLALNHIPDASRLYAAASDLASRCHYVKHSFRRFNNAFVSG